MKEYFQPEVNIYSCEYVTGSFSWNFNEVSAPYWRFYWNFEPGAEILFNGKVFSLKEDSFVMIPPNTCFTSRADGSFGQFYVHFNTGAPYDRVDHGIYIFSMYEELREKILEIKKQLDSSRNDMRFKMLLFSLVYDALLKIPERVFMPEGANYDSRVGEIVKLLDENTSWAFTNEELAEKVSMSVNGFIRLFSGETGTSPQQYSRQKRIEKACLLLHFTKQSIDEIARKTGFQDRYYFSRVFKQITNHSPAQFRKNKKPIG